MSIETTSVVLGSAINEKPLVATPSMPLARLLHASFGLDHYPNYLHRWDLDEITDLEGALEAQLAKVRS